jgi:hypothetical protein
MYMTEGECAYCHSLVRLPTPLDHPDYEESY